MNIPDALIDGLRDAKELERQYSMPFVPSHSGGPYSTEVYEDGIAIRVSVEDTGRYGLRLCHVHLCSDEDDHGADRQRDILLALTTRTSTPYGPLLRQDCDDPLREVLRTGAVGEGRCCYEVVLSEGNDVALTHYAVAAGSEQREAAPVDIGMDMFRIMIGDLVESMRSSLVTSR